MACCSGKGSARKQWRIFLGDSNEPVDKVNQALKCWVSRKLGSTRSKSQACRWHTHTHTHQTKSQQGALSVTWQHGSGAPRSEWDVNPDAPLQKLWVKVSNNKWMHLQESNKENIGFAEFLLSAVTWWIGWSQSFPPFLFTLLLLYCYPHLICRGLVSSCFSPPHRCWK